MNVQLIRTSPVFFKGYGGSTKNINSSNKTNECIHESHFMRNAESLEFVSNYVKKEFPNGTHIADFGCSNGEEAYSLGMLLHDSNKNKKYTITGFDLIPGVVKDAKAALFNIGRGSDNYESFLVSNFLVTTPHQEKIKKKF